MQPMPTDHSYPPAPPAQTAPRRRRPMWPWIAALVVLAAAAGVVGTLVLQRSGGPAPAAKTFVVRGAIDLTGVFGVGATGQSCDTSLRPGANDLAPGGQVVVYDNAGKSLAIGALAEGTIQPDGACRMPFTVTGVPEGPGPFFVEVTHRGRIAFTRAQAANVGLSLALS